MAAPPVADGAVSRAETLRRVHSLAGVVPLGVFVVSHLGTASAAASGGTAFREAVARWDRLPGVAAIEIALVGLPLLFHAGYGIHLAAARSGAQAGPEDSAFPYPSRAHLVLERLTGLVVLAFVAWHLWQFRVPRALGRLEADDLYPALAAALSTTWSGVPWTAAAYLVALAATVYHLVAGLGAFARRWGLVRTARARGAVVLASAAIATALGAWGLRATVRLAIGLDVLAPGAAADGAAPPRCDVTPPGGR